MDDEARELAHIRYWHSIDDLKEHPDTALDKAIDTYIRQSNKHLDVPNDGVSGGGGVLSTEGLWESLSKSTGHAGFSPNQPTQNWGESRISDPEHTDAQRDENRRLRDLTDNIDMQNGIIPTKTP